MRSYIDWGFTENQVAEMSCLLHEDGYGHLSRAERGRVWQSQFWDLARRLGFEPHVSASPASHEIGERARSVKLAETYGTKVKPWPREPFDLPRQRLLPEEEARLAVRKAEREARYEAWRQEGYSEDQLPILGARFEHEASVAEYNSPEARLKRANAVRKYGGVEPYASVEEMEAHRAAVRNDRGLRHG